MLRILDLQSRSLRLHVPGCVHGTVDRFFDTRTYRRKPVTTLKDKSVVWFRVLLVKVFRRRTKYVSESVTEGCVAYEHVLRVVRKVVIGDIKDGDFFTKETGFLVNRVERDFACAERDDFK